MQQEAATNKVLILTVGLPQSGKSTWSRSTGFPMVNPDSIRLALYGQAFIREAEPMVWTMARYMVKSLFVAGHQIVILDATNYAKKFRDEWWNPKEWTCRYKVVRGLPTVCKSRATANGKEYPIPVIERMAENWEPLSEIEQENEIKGEDFL